MSFLKLLVNFAPWISFLIIAHDSVFRVKVGLVTALVLTVGMGFAGMQKGMIRWASLGFFVYATIAVVLFDNAWTLQYMGVIANAALALPVWASILFREPFTLVYAREGKDPSLWTNPFFIRSNYVLSTAWAVTLTLCTALAYFKMRKLFMSDLGYEITSYTLMLLTCAFSSWYPGYMKRQREAQGSQAAKPAESGGAQ